MPARKSCRETSRPSVVLGSFLQNATMRSAYRNVRWRSRSAMDMASDKCRRRTTAELASRVPKNLPTYQIPNLLIAVFSTPALVFVGTCFTLHRATGFHRPFGAADRWDRIGG